MAIFGLFDIGKSAIFASRAALDVTANNIANVNTPGFSRKEAILDIPTPERTPAGFIGRGVTVRHVRRHYDRLLQTQILLQQQNLARSNILGDVFREVEEVFNEQRYPKFSEAFNDYVKAWQEVSVNPEASVQRSVLLQKASALVSMARDMERSLKETIKHVDVQLEDSIERVNALTAEIASINGMIALVETGSSNRANDLRDKRDVLLGELSELTSYNVFEDGRGRINVVMGSRNLVEGENAFTLGLVKGDDGSVEVVAGGEKMNSHVRGGALAGLLDARQEILAGPLKDLRRLVASIVKETNLQHQQGYDLDGSTNNDFFAPLEVFTRDGSAGAAITSKTIADLSQLTLHEYEIRFIDSSTYSVVDTTADGTVISSAPYTSGSTIAFEGVEVVISDDAGGPEAGDTFFISPVELSIENFGLAVTSPEEIAAASADSTLPGDNRNALAMTDLYGREIADLGETFNNRYRTIVAEAGALSSAAEDSANFEQSLLDELNQRREAVSGVNLDEEAANIIRFQKAFEAGARLIKVTDELLEVILNL